LKKKDRAAEKGQSGPAASLLAKCDAAMA
jgi:hypothetical protein